MICNKIKNFLRLAIGRVIFLPVGILLSPFIFMFSGETCKEGKEEATEFLKFAWNGMRL